MKGFSKFLCLFFIALFTGVNGQDASFLNSNQSLVQLNPSFAGSNGFVRNQNSYRRSTRPQFSSSYELYSNATDFFIKPLKAGIALNWMREDFSGGLLSKQ